MTSPDRDTIGTFGGPWNDYQPVLDSSTDVPAAGGNQWAADTAAMTRTATRGWARFTPAGTGSPTLQTNWEQWPSGDNAAPTAARTGVGLYTLTYPATVLDELGANHTLNLLAGDGQCESLSVLWTAQVAVSGNVASIAIFNSSQTLADPNGPVFLVKVY